MSDHFSSDGRLAPSKLAHGLHTAMLPNGLKVIIKEDHRTPVAICNVWVRVGSNREPNAMRGWSHGIEHMLFKGTARRNEGDFANEVAEAGGSTNAGTGYETTNYHITTPASALPVAVDILADALFHSTFDPASLDAERQVLVHENHMYDDIPFGFGITWRWGMELTFDRSPYHHPIGGRDENLLERGREDILAFWRSAYRPDNMTVVVVGDVDPAETFALLQDKFADPGVQFPEVTDPAVGIVAEPPTEPAHSGLRLQVERGDLTKVYAKLIFPGPGEREGLDHVLSVVNRVLSDGRSCRLYRQLHEEKKLVDNFAVMTETGPREGVVLVDIETDAERLVDALAEVARILEELNRNSCTDLELERARTRVSRSFLFGAETVQGQASTIGHHEVMDDLPGAFHFPDRVAGVTKEDVAALCQRIFRLGNVNCLIYLPEDTDTTAHDIPTDADTLQALLKPVLSDKSAGEIPTAAKTAAVEITAPALPRFKGQAAEPFRTEQLANGVEVCYRIDPAVPVLALAMTLKGGSTGETSANAGLATLTQMVQIKGTGNLDAETLHELLEGDGATLSPQADRDYGGMVLSGLADRMDQALELTAQLIHAPSFLEPEIEQERRLALEQLAAIADSPFQAAAVKLRELVYRDHPYGRPLVGTEASLPGLCRDDLVSQHRRIWTADNLQIIAAGALEPDRFLAKLETLLAGLPSGTKTPMPSPGPTQVPDGIVAARIQKKQNQSVVLVAWPGPHTPAENRVPLMMLKEVLNGQSGRLFESLRNQRSLCYNTGTLNTAGFGQGMFMGYVLTAPDTETAAREALVRELEGLAEVLVPVEEFERARAKLLGNLLIGSQSNGARVGRSLRDRVYGRDPNDLDLLLESVAACSAAEVRQVAETLIDPDNRFEVTLGPKGPK
ncbi:MAG: insulinase family protein [Candidatus Krumholzibacteria bacterium]|nr:insulinase family protein [Candidatus Krumholzibacteria bacterium]